MLITDFCDDLNYKQIIVRIEKSVNLDDLYKALEGAYISHLFKFEQIRETRLFYIENADIDVIEPYEMADSRFYQDYKIKYLSQKGSTFELNDEPLDETDFVRNETRLKNTNIIDDFCDLDHEKTLIYICGNTDMDNLFAKMKINQIGNLDNFEFLKASRMFYIKNRSLQPVAAYQVIDMQHYDDYNIKYLFENKNGEYELRNRFPRQ